MYLISVCIQWSLTFSSDKSPSHIQYGLIKQSNHSLNF